MNFEVKISGFEGVLDTLKSLPAEVVSKKGGPVKLALAKGARLLRDYAAANVRQVATDESTGLLAANIVAKRGKVTSGEKYVVTIRRKRYAFRTWKGAATTSLTGSMLEYGGAKQPATPWLRPAGQQHANEIITVVSGDLIRRVDRVVKQLAAKNKGK